MLSALTGYLSQHGLTELYYRSRQDSLIHESIDAQRTYRGGCRGSLRHDGRARMNRAGTGDFTAGRSHRHRNPPYLKPVDKPVPSILIFRPLWLRGYQFHMQDKQGRPFDIIVMIRRTMTVTRRRRRPLIEFPARKIPARSSRDLMKFAFQTFRQLAADFRTAEVVQR